MAWRDRPIDELEFRADLWAGLRKYGGPVLQEALRALADAELAELPCLPVLWEHSRSLHLSEAQLDLVWLHWFVDHRKCPIAETPEAAPWTRVNKLRALLRQALFPHLSASEIPDYRCPAERRAKWATVFHGERLARPRILQFSRHMRYVVDDLEKPAGAGRVADWSYDAGSADAAKRAKVRQADPVGHWVEESVGQFGIAEEFFAARVGDRVALLQRVIRPDAPLPGFAQIEALPAPPDADTAAIEFRNTGYEAHEVRDASLCTSIVAVRGALRKYREGPGPTLPSCHWGELPAELAHNGYAHSPMDTKSAHDALRMEACVVVVSASADVVPAVAKAFSHATVLLLVREATQDTTESYYAQGYVRVIKTKSPGEFDAIRRILTASFVRALFTADHTRLKRLADEFSAYDNVKALELFLAEPVGVPAFVVSMK